MSIDDVLSGKAQFAVVCGDATAVMAALPDGCVQINARSDDLTWPMCL